MRRSLWLGALWGAVAWNMAYAAAWAVGGGALTAAPLIGLAVGAWIVALHVRVAGHRHTDVVPARSLTNESAIEA